MICSLTTPHQESCDSALTMRDRALALSNPPHQESCDRALTMRDSALALSNPPTRSRVTVP